MSPFKNIFYRLQVSKLQQIKTNMLEEFTHGQTKRGKDLYVTRFMTRFSVYLHSLTHSVMLQKEKKRLSQTWLPTFQPSDPPHTLMQEHNT